MGSIKLINATYCQWFADGISRGLNATTVAAQHAYQGSNTQSTESSLPSRYITETQELTLESQTVIVGVILRVSLRVFVKLRCQHEERVLRQFPDKALDFIICAIFDFSHLLASN